MAPTLARHATTRASSVRRELDSSFARRSVPAASCGQQARQTCTRAMRPAVHQAARGPSVGAPASPTPMPMATPMAT